MITSWDVYWITRLDCFNVGFAVAWISFLVLLVASPLILMTIDDFCDDTERGRKIFWKSAKIYFCIALCAFVLNLFVPTTKEFAAIYLIPKIANNEQVQKIPDNALKLLNSKMEQWIDETMNKKKAGE